MKKIATITFHASYNYGSNLQAYALQETVKKILNYECDYKIINLRTDIQKNLYKNCFEGSGLKNKIKSFLLFNQKNALDNKSAFFEKFINEKLNITKEYNSLEQIKAENLEFDYYIAGSDQLWNLEANDFDWSYYLEFTDKAKKISYAASFGPKKLSLSEEEKARIKKDLLKFDKISVREKGSFDMVKTLTGLDSEINVDPTMLLTKEEWEKIIDKKPIINEKYILLYSLKDKEEAYEIAKKISRITGYKVIITHYMGMKYHFSMLKKDYSCGPLEFLNLLKNASLVLSSSFHGTVFSVIFNKPFFAINGLNDFRINNLLEKMNLKEQAINLNDNIEEKCKSVYNINFEEAEKLLNEERKKSELFLKKALDIY